MQNSVFSRQLVESIVDELKITDLAQATIGQVVLLASALEQRTGIPFIRMDQGVPGLSPNQVGIAAEKAAHVAHVPRIHADEHVICVVIRPDDLPGRLAGTVDAVGRQNPPCRRINRIAQFLRAGCRRRNFKIRRRTRLLHQPLHKELRHRTAANVAVADEHDFHLRFLYT